MFHCDSADTLAYLITNTDGLEEEVEAIAASFGQSVDEILLMMSCYTHVTYITVCSNTFTPCAYKKVRCVGRGGVSGQPEAGYTFQ